MRRIVGLLPLLHGVPLAAYLLVRHAVTIDAPAVAPERAWWSVYNLLSLLNEFTPFFFLPLPLWLLTVLLARTWTALLAAAFPWLIFLTLYGALFVPRPAHVAGWPTPGAVQARPLRVMTWNVLGLRRSPQGLIEIIRQANPDVLVAQELTADFAQALDSAIAGSYPHSRLRPAGGALGAGLWSRYPIELEEAWDGSRQNARWQHATISVDGRRLEVVNLHLTPPQLRWRQLETLGFPLVTGEVPMGRNQEVAALVPRLRELLDAGAPIIVAGDLNMTDQTPEYRALRSAGLLDAYRNAGWGLGHTFPGGTRVRIFRQNFVVPVRLLRLDYILHSPQLQTRAAQVWPAGAISDHLPVVVDLMLR